MIFLLPATTFMRLDGEKYAYMIPPPVSGRAIYIKLLAYILVQQFFFRELESFFILPLENIYCHSL